MPSGPGHFFLRLQQIAMGSQWPTVGSLELFSHMTLTLRPVLGLARDQREARIVLLVPYASIYETLNRSHTKFLGQEFNLAGPWG